MGFVLNFVTTTEGRYPFIERGFIEFFSFESVTKKEQALNLTFLQSDWFIAKNEHF